MINRNSLFSGITEVFMSLPFVLVIIFSATLFTVQNVTVNIWTRTLYKTQELPLMKEGITLSSGKTAAGRQRL
jgi:ABC-type dipeptide/oligopeptide/nickel transport system permease subunit